MPAPWLFGKLDVPNPIATTLPSRGVVEVKGTGEEVREIMRDEQILKYLKKFRQVLVTNYRDFLLVVLDDQGQPQALEGYQLAPTAQAFWKATSPSGCSSLRSASPTTSNLGAGHLGWGRVLPRGLSLICSISTTSGT